MSTLQGVRVREHTNTCTPSGYGNPKREALEYGLAFSAVQASVRRQQESLCLPDPLSQR